MEKRRNVDLPEDLICEILLRLPVKALLRFKCVCKEWCALIRSQSFIDGHYGHESNQECLLFRFISNNSQERPRGIEYAMYPDDGRPLRFDASAYLSRMPTNECSLIGPANGIFCMVSPLNRVSLFNPATRKTKKLPRIPIFKPGGLMFGFGFDPFSGDCKVVAFQKYGHHSFFFVYNLSRNSWRKIESVDVLNKMVCVSTIFAVLNGVVHWINMNDDLGIESILVFDMRSENFQEILVPDAIRGAKLRANMTVYGDSIALLSCDSDEVKRCVDLWVMGRDGLWSKSFSVAINLQPLNFSFISPLGVWNKNELLLITLQGLVSAPFKCDVSTQKLRKFGSEVDRLFVCGVFLYRESLVSIID